MRFRYDKTSRQNIHQRIERIERLGDWLDRSIAVPGTAFRVGWDTIIGLIPGVGDFVTTAMSAWIINEARLLGVSRFTLLRMIANTGIDGLLGSVPVAGDLFDAAFKANLTNIKLLRKSLKKRGILRDVIEVPAKKDQSIESPDVQSEKSVT